MDTVDDETASGAVQAIRRDFRNQIGADILGQHETLSGKPGQFCGDIAAGHAMTKIDQQSCDVLIIMLATNIGQQIENGAAHIRENCKGYHLRCIPCSISV